MKPQYGGNGATNPFSQSKKKFIQCYKIGGQFSKVQVYTSAYQFFVLTIYHDTENWKQNIFVIGMPGMYGKTNTDPDV